MRSALVSWLGVLVLATAARGEIQVPAEDGEAVERAAAIVVAHVVPGSIEYVPHERTSPGAGRSWEHHLTIAVTRTVAGELAPGEHRILLPYGMTPCVGGRWKEEGGEIRLTDRAPDVIEIVGDAFEMGPPPVPDDLREDHVWLLRHGTARRAGAPEEAMLSVGEPRDIRPLSRLDYLRLYLAEDPEPGLRRYVQEHPEDTVRVLPYLQHRAVARAIADPDPARRVERLLPFFCSSVLYGGLDETCKAIEAAGDPAVPYLIALLHDSGLYESRRTEVILLLGRIGSRRAVPALLDLLEENRSMLRGVAKSAAADRGALDRPGVPRRLHDMSSAIFSLGRIGDDSAAGAIREIEDEWKAVLPEDHPLTEWCRFARERFAR